MSGPHLSAPALDLLLLPGGAAQPAAKAHLASCAKCQAALRVLEEEKASFERDVLPRTLGKLRARASPPTLLETLGDRLGAKWLFPIPALLLAMGLLVVLRPAPVDDSLGIKGPPLFQLYAARGDQVFAVKDGARLAKGDRIRFVVAPSRREQRFLLIVSRDGEGKRSTYFPPEGVQSAPLSEGRSELPGSIELDASRGTERVHAIFSAQPVTSAEAQAAIDQDPLHPSLQGAAVETLAFEKENP